MNPKHEPPEERNLPVEDEPKRVRYVEIPADGIAVRFADGHEEYIRSCPKCKHRLEVAHADGRMGMWYCPVAENSQLCSFTREPIAKMSRALAADLADVYAPEFCHACGATDLTVSIHRRNTRVEVVVSHPPGHECKAVKNYIFHTYNAEKVGIQEWDEDPGKFTKEDLDRLDEITPEEAEEMLKRSSSRWDDETQGRIDEANRARGTEKGSEYPTRNE